MTILTRIATTIDSGGHLTRTHLNIPVLSSPTTINPERYFRLSVLDTMNTYSYKPGYFIRGRSKSGKPLSGRSAKRTRRSGPKEKHGLNNTREANHDQDPQSNPTSSKHMRQQQHDEFKTYPNHDEKKLTLSDIAAMDETELEVSPFSTPSQSPTR